MNPIGILIALVSTAAWLLLGVWGWGGFQPFFANSARTALVIVTFALMAAAAFTQGNLSPGEKQDRDDRKVLYAMLAIGLVDGWLPAYSERTGLLTVGGDAVRWTGVALFALGGILRILPVFVLGRRFSGLVAIQKDHALVTDGLYSVVRNPSYLGLMITLVGWALAFRSILGLVLAALFLPPLAARMRAEENLLSRHFGAQYDAYRARTWRLIPYLY